MKTITKFLPTLVFLLSIQAFAQSKTDVLRNFANSNDAKISFTSTSETVQFIRFSNTSAYEAKGNNSTTKSFGFIDETRVFGNLSASDFILDNSKEDSHGLEHVTLNQTYNGIPVFDGELKFHFNSSKNISAINGNIVEGIKINTTPAISILEAKNMALELINNQNINYSGKELFVQQNDLLVDLLLANIYDLNGRLIKKVDLENMNVEYAIDITSVSEGLYFIEVVSKDNRHTFKVNKN